jgi:hypothetical protein
LGDDAVRYGAVWWMARAQTARAIAICQGPVSLRGLLSSHALSQCSKGNLNFFRHSSATRRGLRHVGAGAVRTPVPTILCSSLRRSQAEPHFSRPGACSVLHCLDPPEGWPKRERLRSAVLALSMGPKRRWTLESEGNPGPRSAALKQRWGEGCNGARNTHKDAK